MANSETGTSNDVVPASGSEYQVFLSFRGPDTRHGFTDFLYHDLLDVGVHVFRDDDELRVGEVIGENLLSAINNSIIYIPVFSRTYASSKWCLWELAHIVDNVSKSEDEKCILPIFLDVEPDDVKLKTPIYSNALLEHERKFPDKVEAWRAALAAVGKIKGCNVTSSQAVIVKRVVNEVLEKLKIKQKLVIKHLVGLDNQIKELTELLDVNHNDVRLLGIYGMGGIGKTTIAKVVFNQLSSCFGKCCSFLEGIREKSTKVGIVSLQKQLLSDISSSRIVEDIYNSEEGMRRIRSTLNNKKVLVVLDDVDKQELIKNLIGNSNLNRGSRIIITTRDTSILKIEEFEGKTQKYEMLKMEARPALQLFGWHAFSGDFPSDDYRKLSSDIVSCLGGLPLAIEVIGSLLKRRPKNIWEEKLQQLRSVHETKILETLRISYDDLGKNPKQIFLDIACFFFNEEKTDGIYMWTDCEFYPLEGIEILTNRCLIKILDNKFWMHDQLIALGRRIVYEASQDDLENQSRLWIAEEALQIIGTKKMKDKVQALVISRCDPPIEITNENFENLPNLRFLNLNCGIYVGDFAKCHSKLRWFSWRSNLDWQFRAANFYLDKLVVCKLFGLGFKDDSKAWDLIKRAHKLKVLSIDMCNGITTIPDISRCSALERLTLQDCFNLEGIKSFIGDLKSLIDFKILRCCNFTNLPEEVGELMKLERFSLKHCIKFRELPSSLGKLTSLMELDLSETIIRKLPDSIGQFKSLRILRFTLWSTLWSHDWWISCDIGTSVNLEELHTLVNLEELDLSRNNRMRGEIPIEIGEWSSLRILSLEAANICGIPKTINKLPHLQTLDLVNCHNIQELPELPTSLTCLFLISRSLLLVPNLSKLTNLVQLHLSDRSSDRHESNLIPGGDLSWIGNLSKLEYLHLNLQNVPAPLELASLSHLKWLVLDNLDLKPLVQLPSSDWNFRSLSTLRLVCCEGYVPLKGFSQLETLHVAGVRLQRLSIPPELKKLREVCVCARKLVEIQILVSQLENLYVQGARLQRLSIPPELKKLQNVGVSACEKLVEIQILGLSKSLENMRIASCKSLTRISGLSYLKNLSELRIETCDVLTNVEGLNELESLKFLLVRYCKSLARLIDASCTKIPDDCTLEILFCGYPVKDAEWGMHVKHYKEEILMNGLNKISFTIIFHFGVKKSSERFEFVGGIKREKEGVNIYSVTYEGLVADVKNFGFCLKRMWYRYPHLLREIKSDWDVNRMLEDASRQGFLVHLFVEGGVDSEWEGEHDEEMLREEHRIKTDVYSDEDETKWWGFSSLDSDSDLDSDLEPLPAGFDLFSPQMSLTIRFHLGVKWFSGEFGCIGGVEREKEGVNPDTVTYEGLIADVKNFGFRMKRMRYEVPRRIEKEIECDGDVDYMLNNCFQKGSLIHLLVEGEVDSEWEGEYDDEMMKMLREQQRMKMLNKVKRDKNVETDRVPTKTGRRSGTGCASKPGRDPIERGRGRGRASSSRNGEGLSLGRDAASSLGRGTAPNSGREIASSSQSSTTSSLRRDRGSTSGKGTTLTSGRGMFLSLGMDRGSSSRTDTTKMGTTSNPRRGITSSSRSRASLSMGRGRGSTLGEGATVSSGRGMTLSLGTGRGSSSRTDTTKMGTASIPGRGITSSSQSGTSLSTGRGRGSTSGNDTTASSRRGKTLSSGRGATKMGTSLRSGTNKGLSLAKAEPPTSRSLEEQ